MGVQIGRKCERCNDDNWYIIDGKDNYAEVCDTCFQREKIWNEVSHKKHEYLDNFECPECGGLSGTIEENKKKLGVRCSNCGKLTIMLEKHEAALDNRNAQGGGQEPQLTCPKCGSTQITTGACGVNWTRGLIGASKTVNRCGKCGYTWRPGR